MLRFNIIQTPFAWPGLPFWRWLRAKTPLKAQQEYEALAFISFTNIRNHLLTYPQLDIIASTFRIENRIFNTKSLA
jgi:hypothetical protein